MNSNGVELIECQPMVWQICATATLKTLLEYCVVMLTMLPVCNVAALCRSRLRRILRLMSPGELEDQLLDSLSIFQTLEKENELVQIQCIINLIYRLFKIKEVYKVKF